MDEDLQFEIDFCRSILKRDTRNIPVMEMLAGFLTKSGQIDEGLEMDQQIVELDPDNAISHYNLACSLALKNRAAEALAALRMALERGYDDFDWLMKDNDLLSLHQNPAFSALVSEFRASNS